MMQQTWNLRWGSAISISEMRRNLQDAALANAHVNEALIPTFDHLNTTIQSQVMIFRTCSQKIEDDNYFSLDSFFFRKTVANPAPH